MSHHASLLLFACAVAVLGLGAAPCACDAAPASTRVARTLGTSTPASVAPRTLYFHNQCPFEVRMGATGGNTGLVCGTSSDCPGGTWCGGGFCYFQLPTTDMPAGSTAQHPLPKPIVTHSGQAQVWSGAVFASTGCASEPGCATAVCPGGECTPSAGPVGPRSLAEFTLQPHANDYYDVSIINGINVPISMQPLRPTGHVWGKGVNVDPRYWCATPGATTLPSGSGLAACSWNFTAPSSVGASNLLLVSRSASPAPCSSDADCSSTAGHRCGLQMDVSSTGGATPSLSKACGTPLGWWTADEVCAWTDAKPYGAPFNCGQTTAQGGSLTDLYACSGGVYGHSCYSTGASDSCCGCADWPKLGVPAPAAQPCVNVNKVWVEEALPQVQFLKAACPTAYTYPFDDMSSTFQAYAMPPNTPGANNTASYQITFCPGGATGVPM